MEELGALFGSLFGDADDAEEMLVRVSQAGDETIAGHAAEHYVVETGNENDWRVYEELWIAPGLLADLMAEVGACVDTMFEFQGDLMPTASTRTGELDAVLASPDYQALIERGFPVRTKESMSFFGMTIETMTEVVEVNRHTIPEDAFAIPPGYQRVDSPLELMDM